MLYNSCKYWLSSLINAINLNYLNRSIKILVCVIYLLLNSLSLIGQLDSSLGNSQKKFTNHLDFSGSNSYFRRLENVIKQNYIVGFSANHKLVKIRKSKRNSFLSYGINFQYQSIKFVDIFRELQENESTNNSYSINGHKNAAFIFAGVNFSWGYLFNYKRIEIELFQRSTFNYLISTNADNYEYSKDYGCAPPGVPSNCNYLHNYIIYANSMLPLELGTAVNLRIKEKNRLTLKYSNNLISWGLIRSTFFISQLVNGNSLKQIKNANKGSLFDIGGGIRIRYFPDLFFINSLNIGYQIKI